jgi:hypothetical protein
MGIFIVAWNSRKFSDNNFLLFIGIAYFFIGSLDLLHIMSHPDLGIIKTSGINLDQQIRIAGRYLEATSFLVALLATRKRVNAETIFLAYSVIFLGIFLTIFQWHIFPEAYDAANGATTFKKISDWLAIAMLIIAAWLLIRKKADFDPGVRNILFAVLTLMILNLLVHTPYLGMFSLLNMTAHSLRFMSFYLLYKAVIEAGLMHPYRTLFRNLKENEMSLIYSQAGLEDKVNQKTAQLAKINDRLRREIAQRSKIENELLKSYEYLGIMNRKITLLSEFSQYLQKKKEVLGYILGTAVTFSNASAGLIYLQTEDSDSFSLALSRGVEKNREKEIRIISSSSCRFLDNLAKNKCLISGVPDGDLGRLEFGERPAYFLALPFLINKKLKGFLFLSFLVRSKLDSHEIDFFNVFSINSTMALINSGFLK